MESTTLINANGTIARNSIDANDPLVIRTRAIWTSGPFGRIADGFSDGAEEFITRLAITPGERVLDVATGTGNLALPAARAGAIVTAQDIAPNLLDEGRRHAEREGLAIQFDEGNCEHLPYDDDSFDTIVTMFGAMFAPRPDHVVNELLRVCRKGGRIAMANWAPSGFIGEMLKAHVALVPPPAGLAGVLLWGDETVVRERFAARGAHVTLHPRTITFNYPYSPEGVVELFRACYGPTIRAFEALDVNRRATLYRDLVRMWTSRNLATDGTTRVEAEYLEVAAVVA